MFVADFHMHSTFSDGKLTIPELVDHFGQNGVGAIAITDHLCETDTVWGKFAHYLGLTLTRATFPLYMAILASEAKRAWDRYRMVVIPGFEITKNAFSAENSAHIVALGVTKWVSADANVANVIKEIKSHGGLAIAAHPRPTKPEDKQTFYLWNNRQQLEKEFDAWEVANGQAFFEEVENSPLPKLANSDFHRPGDFSSWKTVLGCRKDPQIILQAIRAQALTYEYISEVELDEAPVPAHVGSLARFREPYALGNLAFDRAV